jgi:hypothetical protein
MVFDGDVEKYALEVKHTHGVTQEKHKGLSNVTLLEFKASNIIEAFRDGKFLITNVLLRGLTCSDCLNDRLSVLPEFVPVNTINKKRPCKGCQKWFPQDVLVSASVPTYGFEFKGRWYLSNSVYLCQLCRREWRECPGCGDWVTAYQLNRYERCVQCNNP